MDDGNSQIPIGNSQVPSAQKATILEYADFLGSTRISSGQRYICADADVYRCFGPQMFTDADVYRCLWFSDAYRCFGYRCLRLTDTSDIYRQKYICCVEH